MSGLSIDRSSRRMDVDVKEMDVIVAEFINGKLLVRMERIKLSKN
jgi:hypothetical protein